jgi:signal transduction histidine kinase
VRAWLGAVLRDFAPWVADGEAARRPRRRSPTTAVGDASHPQRKRPAFLPLHRQGRLRPQCAIVVLALLIVVAYAGATWFSLARFHHRTLREAAAALDDVGRSVEIGTRRSLLAVSALLFGVAPAMAALPPATPLDDPAIGALLRSFSEQGLPFCNLLLVDRRGRLVNAAQKPPGPTRDYAASPFFTAHLAKTAPFRSVDLVRDEPPQGRSLIVSRPLFRDGRFAGVIAAEMPTASLAAILRAVVGGRGIEASLLLDRGALLAADPARPGMVGHVPRFAGAFLGNKERSPPGVFAGEGQGKLHNIRRFAAFPLIAAVSRERAAVLRRWSHVAVELLVGFMVFALTAATLTFLIVRALNRRERAALDLQRSEARFKRQSALLQSTLESMTEGLSVFDRNGRLIAWNQRFCELLELPPLTFGMGLSEILMRQAARGDFGEVAPEAEVARRLAEFHHVPQIKERLTPSGRILQIRRSAMPDGAVLSMYSDITDLKNSEKNLIEARRQAEAANQAKSEFLANMSHELRTPLNAVIGFSEVIVNQIFGPLRNDKYLEYIRDIHSSSMHLLAIINDVLDMSKIEAGKLDLSRQTLRLQSVAAVALRILHERAESRRIALVPEFAAEDVVIWADERAIKQVFLNLLANAIKFSREGGTVHLRVVHDGPAIAIAEVEDHGIGMTAEEQERALEPFAQAQATTTRNYGGTGLGLPITKGLVEAHGGRLTITSRPGHGTTVRLILPTEEAWLLAAALQPQGAAAD